MISSSRASSAPTAIKFVLIKSALQTTLCLALPILLLFFAGLLIDLSRNQNAQHHSPFFAISGAILGFFIGALLIYLQIRQINSRNLQNSTQDKINSRNSSPRLSSQPVHPPQESK